VGTPGGSSLWEHQSQLQTRLGKYSRADPGKAGRHFRIIPALEYLPCPPCAMRDDEAEIEPSARLAVESLRGHCV
jgi:hypothetical protein